MAQARERKGELQKKVAVAGAVKFNSALTTSETLPESYGSQSVPAVSGISCLHICRELVLLFC